MGIGCKRKCPLLGCNDRPLLTNLTPITARENRVQPEQLVVVVSRPLDPLPSLSNSFSLSSSFISGEVSHVPNTVSSNSPTRLHTDYTGHIRNAISCSEPGGRGCTLWGCRPGVRLPWEEPPRYTGPLMNGPAKHISWAPQQCCMENNTELSGSKEHAAASCTGATAV